MVEYVPEKNHKNTSGTENHWNEGEIVVVLSKKNDRGIWPLGKF